MTKAKSNITLPVNAKQTPDGFHRSRQLKNSEVRFFKPEDESVFYGVYVGQTTVEHKGKVHIAHVFNEIGCDSQVIMSDYASLKDVIWNENFCYEIEVADRILDDKGGLKYYKFNVYEGSLNTGDINDPELIP